MTRTEENLATGIHREIGKTLSGTTEERPKERTEERVMTRTEERNQVSVLFYESKVSKTLLRKSNKLEYMYMYVY